MDSRRIAPLPAQAFRALSAVDVIFILIEEIENLTTRWDSNSTGPTLFCSSIRG